MFNGAKTKVRRARHHIENLRTTFNEYVERQPCKLNTSAGSQGNLQLRAILNEEIPEDLTVIAGDAIHNLRTSLDHATWELVGLDGGVQDRYLKFPTGGSGQTDYNSYCRGMKTPRDDTKEFFVALGAYKENHSILYALNELDNIDKHMIIVPVMSAIKISEMRILYPDGTPMTTMIDTTYGLTDEGTVNVASVGQGLTLEIGNNTTVTPQIFIWEPEVMRAKPFLETIEDLANSVEHTIQKFEEFVRSRPKNT